MKNCRRNSAWLTAALICTSCLAAGSRLQCAELKNPFFAFDNGTGRGKLPPAAQAELLQQLGYAGLGYTGAEGIPEMLRALDDKGLKMSSIYVAARVGPGGASYDPKLKEALKQLAGRDTLVWLTVQGGQASSSDYDEQAVGVLREVADLAAENGLRVALYPHTGFYVARVEDALRLVRKVDRPNLGASFNLCHFLKLDDESNLEQVLEAARPHLFAVSINGADGGDTRQMNWDRLIQTLDRGSFAVGRLLTVLQRLGYAGPIGLQCYAIPGDERDNLGRSMAAWRKLCAAVAAPVAPPIIAVPVCDKPVQIAVALPPNSDIPGDAVLRLVNCTNPDDAVEVQHVVGDSPDAAAIRAAGTVIATVPPREASGETRLFRLESAKPATGEARPAFHFQELSSASLQVLEGDRPVFVYNHGPITNEQVPEDDTRRTRGCYIHPVWGLDGEVLTDDFPKDHYHHHGAFWAWPHVLRNGQEYDLWVSRGIEQRFVRWLCRETGPIAAVLAVENGWFMGDEKVVTERVCLRLFPATDDGQSLDLEFEWTPVGGPITLWGAEGKSYGGLTMRYAPRQDTVITVPDGRTTEDLYEKPLAWADMSARFEQRERPSGAAVLVDPRHPDYPPTWLTRHYGALCVGWPGVVSKTFEPGIPFRTSYRIWIHRGQAELAVLQSAYAAYTASAKADWTAQSDTK